MIYQVTDEMDASRYMIPEIAREIDRRTVTKAKIYAKNNIMDQIYEREEDESTQELLDIKEFDSDYGLAPVTVSPHYEPVTSKMTKNHRPSMSEVQIMNEITDTVTNEAYRDSIFNLITTLQANQPEMSIFDVRISMEKGSPLPKYRVTLDIPYDTVINKETKDRVARNSQWTISWFQIRQDIARRQCLTLTLTPIIDDPITTKKNGKPRREALPLRSPSPGLGEAQKDVALSDATPLLMNTREVYRIIDSRVVHPLNGDISDMIDSLISGESSPSITSFKIKRDPTQTGMYNIEMGLHQTECTHGGGITWTTMNNIIEAFRDTWYLVFRIMFDAGRTLRITATYIKSTECLTKEDVDDYVDMNAVMSMDRFPIKKMIKFITNDTKMGIHALEIKRIDDKRFSVSMDVENGRPVSLDDDIEIMKIFNNSWALSFQHDLMGNGPIRRIIVDVTRRSYLTTA